MTSATKVVFTLKLMIDKILYTNTYLGSTLRKKENIYNTITSYLTLSSKWWIIDAANYV